MLLFAFGLMMLATAAAGEDVITAASFIIPNTKPPAGLQPSVVGKVTMTQPRSGGNTIMEVHLKGLPPTPRHGFHIHEYGDIFTQGCQSTGSHYNPENYHHGAPGDEIRHVGDLGNLVSNEAGYINAKIIDRLVSLRPTQFSCWKSICDS
ncbi:hypothetical protein OS493_033999 [Desmophyllum pertusum]|uniref:Superoxide dismutase copper/zinc binding domain-containing protein n=1 Tax=Desmophyllum pertusum TaxID=174260 RepID=A0A9X0CW54_9CNID|nr:hypothetical protein OS493_033999 [Desmophyllum pertusum]